MRQFDNTGYGWLYPNSSAAETSGTGAVYASPTATGFKTYGNNAAFDYLTDSYIYIAIRRPMKTPESGTEVFEATSPANGTGSNATINSNFTVDLILNLGLSAGIGSSSFDRLRGRYLQLLTNETAQEVSRTDTVTGFDVQKGFTVGSGSSGYVNNASYNYNNLLFKRATGFFDVVAYTGDGVAGRTVAHNLGVAPELMIVKRRDTTANWQTYHSAIGATGYLTLDTTNAATTSSSRWNDTEPTSTEFTLAASGGVNNSGGTFVAYLFATLAGVSKVGSYTGNGGGLIIDCGFSNGARFVLIKRTNTTGNWMVFDTARGILAGSGDPYLELNTTDAEVAFGDYIVPNSSGFEVRSFTNPPENNVNANGDSYIFLAIA